jgi:hypothetical protein
VSNDYQAVYDAVNLNFSGASYLWQHAQQEIYAVSHEMQRPSAIYRPSISKDGNKWCALYGENLQDGVAGFGDTPADAMAAFDKAWRQSSNPQEPTIPASLATEAAFLLSSATDERLVSFLREIVRLGGKQS